MNFLLKPETQVDQLLATIKSATNPFELLEVTSCKRKELTVDHLLHAFKALFAMQRNEEYDHTAEFP